MDAIVIVRDSPMFRAWATQRGAVLVAAVGIAATLSGGFFRSLALTSVGLAVITASLLSLTMATAGDAYGRVRQKTDADCPYPSWYIFFELVFNPGNITPVLHRHALRARSYFTVKDFVFFGRKTYMITSEELIHTVLVSSGASFEKMQMGNAIYGWYSLLDGGDTESWSAHRHNLSPYFRYGIEGFRPKLEEIAQKHVGEWRKARRFDLLSSIFRLILNIHFTAFFNYEPSESELDFIIEASRYFIVMPNMTTSHAKEMARKYHEKMAEALNGSAPGTLGALMNDMVTSGKMTQDEARANTGMIFMAQTPVFALFWSIVNIANAGQFAQERAREDPDYLEACIKETIRMYPPVPNMYIRQAMEDVTADGVTIEKGSRVVIFPLWVHHDPKLWTDPSTFNPDRFLDQPKILDDKSGAATTASGRGVPLKDVERILQKGDKAHSSFRPNQGNGTTTTNKNCNARFMPFGLGKHQCLGRHFAIMEVKTIVKTILQNCTINIEEDNGLLEIPLFHRLHPKGAGYFFPSRDVTIKLTSVSVTRALARLRGIAAMGLLRNRSDSNSSAPSVASTTSSVIASETAEPVVADK